MSAPTVSQIQPVTAPRGESADPLSAATGVPPAQPKSITGRGPQIRMKGLRKRDRLPVRRQSRHQGRGDGGHNHRYEADTEQPLTHCRKFWPRAAVSCERAVRHRSIGPISPGYLT